MLNIGIDDVIFLRAETSDLIQSDYRVIDRSPDIHFHLDFHIWCAFSSISTVFEANSSIISFQVGYKFFIVVYNLQNIDVLGEF